MMIQKIVTYLLHNKEAIPDLYSDKINRIFDFELTEEELIWLREIDPRRWTLDPELPHRSLQGALTRCPVSLICFDALFKELKEGSLSLPIFLDKASNSISALLNFFQSDLFKSSILNDGYLVTHLIDWIIDEFTKLSLPPKIALSRRCAIELMLLERSVFTARSSSPLELINPQFLKTSQSEHQGKNLQALMSSSQTESLSQIMLTLPQNLILTKCKMGVTECYQHLNHLAIDVSHDVGVTALLQTSINLSELPISGSTSQAVLIKITPNGSSLETLSESFAEVIKSLSEGINYLSFLQLLMDSELDEAEAQELIEEWVEEGLIDYKIQKI